MNDHTTFLDDQPDLPDLDALARRSVRSLQAEASTFDVAHPAGRPRQRSVRVLGVAAAVLVVLAVAAAVVVGTRDDDGGQRTVVGPETFLFPSAVPDGFRFTRASDLAVQGDLELRATSSQVRVFRSSDPSGAVAVWTATDPRASSLLETEGATHVEVDGHQAVIDDRPSGTEVLSIVVRPDRVVYVLASGLSRTELVDAGGVAVRAAADGTEVSAGDLPGRAEHVVDMAFGRFLQLWSSFAVGLSPMPGRTLSWEAGSDRSFGVITSQGTETDLDVLALFTPDGEDTTVDGHRARHDRDASTKVDRLVWLDDGTLVMVIGTGVDRALLESVAESLRPVDRATYERLVADGGGALGAVEDGKVLVAQGGGTDQPWRVVVAEDDPSEMCVERASGAMCSSIGQTIATVPVGAEEPTTTVPVGDVTSIDLEKSQEPTVAYGRVPAATVSATVTVGTWSESVKLVEVGGAKWFAVAVPAEGDPTTVVAYDAAGKEISRAGNGG